MRLRADTEDVNTAENNLWGWLYKYFRTMDQLDWQRVENGVGGGTPDVEVCFRGIGFWIELKVAEARKRGNTCNVSYRPLQLPWLKRRTKKGGRAFVLIQYRDKRYLVPGNKAALTEGTVQVALLEELSITDPDCGVGDILRACISHQF